MKGVWLDGKATCLDQRTLRVSIQIDLVSPAGKTTRIKRARAGTVDNCAEGGPNFGFDLKPRAYRMACANGRWKPGRYSLTIKTTHVRSGLLAQASLYHQVTRPCSTLGAEHDLERGAAPGPRAEREAAVDRLRRAAACSSGPGRPPPRRRRSRRRRR